MTDLLTGAELADTIRSIIRIRPDLHDQGYWFNDEGKDFSEEYSVKPEDIPVGSILNPEPVKEVSCGTTFCVAGWALVLNGYELRRTQRPSRYAPSVMVNTDIAVKDGEEFDIQQKAAELLVIDDYDADRLFDSVVEREDILDALDNLSNGDTPYWAYREDPLDDDYYED